jgi:hypothetical protein
MSSVAKLIDWCLALSLFRYIVVCGCIEPTMNIEMHKTIKFSLSRVNQWTIMVFGEKKL